MKIKKMICGMVAALAAGPAFGAITYEDVTRIDQGAAAYYNFNEASGTTAADAVGSNDGAYGAGVTVNQSTAPRPLTYRGFTSTNTSALLDASSSSSRVTVPTAVNMSSAAGSVSMWVNTSALQLSDTDAVGLFYGTDEGGGDGFGGQNELHLGIQPTGELRLFARGATNVNVQTAGDANLDDGAWHHVAATWNQGSGQINLYVDGNNVASGSGAFNNFNFSDEVRLGELGSGGNHLNRQYGGYMDEVAVYNTDLTSQQVTDQYHAAVYHYDTTDFVYTAANNTSDRIVGEGEVFMSRSDDGANGWRIVPDESAGAGTLTNARGTYVQSLPDNGSPGTPNGAPSIEYKIQIDTPGVYQLYTRWDGNATTSGTAGSSDSLFVDIVEIKGVGTDWYEMTLGASLDGNFATNSWDGTGEAEVNVAGAAGNPITFNFTSAGEYTLRYSQREDAAAVDAWVLQPEVLAAPTGVGPTVSGLQLEVEAEHYTRRGDNGSGQSWQLVDADAGTGNLGDGEVIGDGGKFANAQNGHYMQVLDDNNNIYNTTATVDDGPYLDFDITAPMSGFYQLSVRFDGFSGDSDSLYARILGLEDGLGGDIADWYRFVENGDASFGGWLNMGAVESTDAGGGETLAGWRLVAGQSYTLRFQPREDGVSLDAFRLTLVIPEPASAVSMLGLLAVGAARRRRR
ncbi:LamG domain-containing protein [Planctomycetales bacterium ZRK34]|nr:LamG domain-containing protein [Planctomycetales bacterium ZRK34]